VKYLEITQILRHIIWPGRQSMPTIAAIGPVKVQMFYGDHNPPHVHVYGGGHTALIRIEDCEFLSGSLPPRLRRRVCAWIDGHRDKLMTLWSQYRGN
jgi:hypothetical protein